LQRLEELYISKNILDELDKDIFKNLPALTILELNENKTIGNEIAKQEYNRLKRIPIIEFNLFFII